MRGVNIHHLNFLHTTNVSDEKLTEYLLNTSEVLLKYDKATTSEEREDLSREYKRLIGEPLSQNKVKQRDLLCATCGTPFEKTRSFSVCLTCGATDENSNTYLAPLDTIPVKSFEYQRQNHFRDWLHRLQAKQSKRIPAELLDEIRVNCRRHGMTDLTQLTADRLRVILKKMGRSKYFEHTSLILSFFTGRTLVISEVYEAKLFQMFRAIQTPYAKHKPPSRKSMISYPYLLKKFFMILKLDIDIPLLKNREKLATCESVFKKICADLGWEFIPSI